MYYAFEAVMLNEFFSNDYTCSTSDLVPSSDGSTQPSIVNQVCAVIGSSPGQNAVPGSSFLQAQYGFQKSHLWRNIGINAAWFVFFAVCVCVGMELFKPAAGRLATVMYATEPVDISSSMPTSNEDIEKQVVDDDVPPLMRKTTTRKSGHGHKATLDRDEHVFAWKSLSLDIKTDHEMKRILDNVDGWVRPGEMTALMGMSGAGKTTLLNTLAQRIEFGNIGGDLYLDGRPLPKSIGRRIGYVQQQDVHLPTATVREALQMTARLRRPMEIPLEEKEQQVEAVIDMLEMEDIAEALIGIPGAGLNLEQRKRVSIGVELAAKPEILFLDEPTSGLDGANAESIIRLLRKLADAGQTILCTIHQPAAQLIETFDSLLLLVPGGKTAYFGALGQNCNIALDYFSSTGHARRAREKENPAEYFLQVTSNGNDWPQIWRESKTSKERDATLEALIKAPMHRDTDTSAGERTYATPLYHQFEIVLRRTWLYYWRDPDYGQSKLLMNMFNGLINGLSFLQLGDSLGASRNRIFSLFIALIVGPPLSLQLEPRFTTLREIFMVREKRSRTYNWVSFVISAIIVELPYALFCSLIYWLLWYFPLGYFYASDRAGYTLLMYLLFSVFYTSLGQLIAAAMPSLSAALMATGFFWLFVNTFNGPLSPPPLTPAGWRWYYKVAPLYYFVEGVSTNVMHGLDIVCKESELSTFIPPSGQSCKQYAGTFLNTATGYVVNPDSTTECQYCPYSNGDRYLQQYGFSISNRWKDVGVFIGFIAFNYTVVIVATYLIFVRQWRKRQ